MPKKGADRESAPALERQETYDAFQRDEGIPVVRGFAVDDLRTVPVAPWPRTGGRGTFINLEGAGAANDAYLSEIPPGGQLAPQRHVFEEMIYVLDGNGSTSVWYDERRKVSFEWGPGSLFAIPLNAWHQHFNGAGLRPARYLGVTSAPIVINLFHNLRFVFENDFVFDDRFGGQEGYFEAGGIWHRGGAGRTAVLETNFVPDTGSIELYGWSERGGGGRSVFFELAHNTMAAHISEFSVGTYKKAHRHGAGAHVIILGGTGYSLLWPEGEERTRVDWKAGSLVVPPNDWFHQHFNNGAVPSRYLALRWGSQRYGLGGAIGSPDGGGADVSVRLGGAQIEYEDEDPEIHREFEAEVRRAGAECNMRSMIAACTGRPTGRST